MTSILTHPFTFPRTASISRVLTYPSPASPAARRIHPHAPQKRSFHPHAITATNQLTQHSTDDHSTDDHPTDDQSIDTNVHVQRTPNYSGWWTEVMKVRIAPQKIPDPTLNLSEGHVFQGTPVATTTATVPDETFNPLNPLGTRSSNSTVEIPASTISSAASTQGTDGNSNLGAAPDFYDYQGFKIPIKPNPPGSEDCCMSGCAVCVYDIYEEDRHEYKERLAVVLKQLEAAGIPLPPDLAAKKAHGAADKDNDDDMDPSMKAFLELERKLKGG